MLSIYPIFVFNYQQKQQINIVKMVNVKNVLDPDKVELTELPRINYQTVDPAYTFTGLSF